MKRAYPESWCAIRHRAPRVATLANGQILALSEPGLESTDRAVLHLCPPGLAREGFDGPGLYLVGPGAATFRCAQQAPLSCGIWIDASDRLWLTWSDGTGLYTRHTKDPVSDPAPLGSADAWVPVDVFGQPPPPGDAIHLGDGSLHPTDPDSLVLAALSLPAGGIHIVTCGASASHTLVHPHPLNHSPSLTIDPDGSCLHVVWDTEDLRILYQREELPLGGESNAQHPTREPEAEDGRGSGQASNAQRPSPETTPTDIWRGCHNPDVASNGRQVVVAYTGHMQHIKYGWFDGSEWHLDNHLTTLHPRFHETLEHSPWFWTDPAGAIHLSFVCLTRSLAFDSKWLGDHFSDPQPVDGLFHPSAFIDEVRVRAERISLDHGCGTLLLSSTFLPERHGIYTQQSPPVDVKPGEPLLMFDTDAIDELLNGKAELETMVVDPPHPVLEPTDSEDDFDASRVLGGGTVLKDGDRYRMWYGAVGLVPEEDVPWYDQVYVGYAESADGVQWQRTDTGGGSTFRGRPAPNRISNVDHNACVFIDPEDEPARRYKAIKFESRAQRYDHVAATGETGYLGLPRRGWLSTSPDGLRWEREEIVVDFPGVETYGCQPQGAIYDPRDPDPARRYKIIGFTSLIGRRRGATLACSPDCRRWTVAERTPLLDSMMAVTPVRPAGPYGQLHDATIARYGRYLLAFYQNQFDGDSADIRLAWSLNGERFRFAFPETPLVGLGASGTWNSGYLMNSSLVTDDERMLLYYGAASDKPFETLYGCPMIRVCATRSAARLDRLARVSPRETGVATLLTAPLTVEQGERPLRLEVNADLGTSGQLRAGIVDADAPNRELPGYEMASCVPLAGDDLHHRVRWESGGLLPTDPSHFRIRLQIEGSTASAIYSLRVCTP